MSPLITSSLLTICFVAGKSGGHLLPCITQAQHYQQEEHATVYLFSTGCDLDKKIVGKHTSINHYIPTKLYDVPYQQPWLLPLFACNVAWYFIKSCYKLWQIKPAKVISFGGFNAVPVCLAAWLLRIPFEIYELNVEPGKATKFLSHFTDKVHICFQQTKNYFPKKTCVPFQYPIRFGQDNKQYDKKQLLQKYGFFPERKTLVILGGSQGSSSLNEIVKNYIQAHPACVSQIQVIHQTGEHDFLTYKDFYQHLGIPAIVFGYHEGLQDFYNLADSIICRAGAGTLFEIKFFKKSCICIPHETKNTNHQIQNCLALAAQYPKQFTIIKQTDCNEQTLFQALKNFKFFSDNTL